MRDSHFWCPLAVDFARLPVSQGHEDSERASERDAETASQENMETRQMRYAHMYIRTLQRRHPLRKPPFTTGPEAATTRRRVRRLSIGDEDRC